MQFCIHYHNVQKLQAGDFKSLLAGMTKALDSLLSVCLSSLVNTGSSAPSVCVSQFPSWDAGFLRQEENNGNMIIQSLFCYLLTQRRLRPLIDQWSKTGTTEAKPK